jgi:hypothetical protein
MQGFWKKSYPGGDYFFQNPEGLTLLVEKNTSLYLPMNWSGKGFFFFFTEKTMHSYSLCIKLLSFYKMDYPISNQKTAIINELKSFINYDYVKR